VGRIRTFTSRPALAALALALGACHAGRASAVLRDAAAPEAYTGVVTVSAFAPPGAQEVALAQSVGEAPFEDLVETLCRKVAAVGGDWAVIDAVRTNFEVISYTESYTYSCGTTQSPRTCSGTRLAQREAATTTIDARALRTRPRP
jgi:hypothetical protein